MMIKSLHIKLSLSVAAAALFVVMLSSYFFYKRSYENSFADSERSVRQLLETVSNTAAIAAYVGNRELAQEVVAGLSINDIVVGAQIRAGDDIIGQQGKPVSDSQQTPISLNLKAPFDEQEVVGVVAVLPNLPLIALRARDSATATTIGLAAQAAVVALLVLIMVYWMMTRPLASLSGRLHRITPGDGNRLDVAGLHRSDEIGLLVGDINSLLNTVEKMLEEERQLRHRVELLEHRFRGIFEDSSAGIFLVHDHGLLVTANPAFFRITELTDQTPASLGTTDIIKRIFIDATKAEELIQQALHTQHPCSADLRIKSHQQDIRWVHCIFSPAGSEQQTPTVEGVIYDITQRKISEEHTRELAEKDSLTGLFNRQAVDAFLANLSGIAGKGWIMMMIDLDGFKYVNDTYGHEAGDEVLKVVASRLRSLVRDSDIVARLGGDEFLIVLNQTKNLTMARTIAQKIVTAQQDAIEIQPGVYETVGISIGIALYPDHGDNEISVRRHADQAMYAVKRRGKNGYAVYDEESVPREKT
jgi:diguanylate cyclase (GGDEF)-like protein/PAS domain S-box-containing protein